MPRLRIEIAGQPTSEVDLEESGFTIGRGRANDLHFSNPWLSRYHARIGHERGSYFLEDLGSRNGTYLNGRRLRTRKILANGDAMTLGDVSVRYMDGTATGFVRLGPKERPLPQRATVLLHSNELEIDRYGQTQYQKTTASTGDSFWPTVNNAASALIANYPRQELLELILTLSREAVAAERGALLLGPRGSRTPKAEAVWSPEVEEAEETGSLLDPVERTTTEISPLTAEQLATIRGPSGTIRKPTAAELEPAESELHVEAVFGYREAEEVHISRTIIREVLVNQKAVLTLDARTDKRFGEAISIQMEGIRSIICVPLWNNREVIGLIYLDHRLSGQTFSETDLRLVGLIANMAAVKIENSYLLAEQIEKKRMEEQLAVGAEIQRRLLPRGVPQIPGYDLHGVNRSCFEVGGDYYDFIPREDGQWALVIADISGKGVGAALLMAVLQASLRALVPNIKDPVELFEQLNRVLLENSPSSKYATLFYAELDPQDHMLTYVNGGNQPGLLATESGIETLDPSGPIVGLVPKARFESRRLAMPPGARLLLCTDGVTELVSDSGEDFGNARVETLMRENPHLDALALAEALQQKLAEFTSRDSLDDDTTVVILRRLASGESLPTASP